MIDVSKALRLLPPESAHKISVWALKNGLGPTVKQDDPRLQITLLGKTFSNLVGLSAGAEKKAEALQGWTRVGFGFVEAGTVTLNPRAGNPKPRVWRLKDGASIINWMGLPGEGLAPFVANLDIFSKTPERKKLVLGISIGSPEGIVDDFRKIAFAVSPFADYITLNASCPNVAHGDANAAAPVAAQIKATIQEAGGRPVLLKLGPTRDTEILKLMVGTAMEAGAAGIVATNTMPFDKKNLLSHGDAISWPLHDGKPVGGYSGPDLLETTCWMTTEIRALIGTQAPIIGVGGIQSGADALRVLQAGADLIQLYTGLIYKGPALLEEIKAALLREAL